MKNRLNIHELTLLSKLTSGLSIHHELKQPVFMTYLQNQYMGISSKRKVMLIDKYSTFVLQFAIRLLSSTVFVWLEFSIYSELLNSSKQIRQKGENMSWNSSIFLSKIYQCFKSLIFLCFGAVCIVPTARSSTIAAERRDVWLVKNLNVLNYSFSIWWKRYWMQVARL